jgi:hypothetical protein
MRKTIIALLAALTLTGLALPAASAAQYPRGTAKQARTADCASAGRQLVRAGFRSYTCRGTSAYSGPFWIAYAHDTVFQIAGAGINEVAKLSEGNGQLYVIEINSSHLWRFHEDIAGTDFSRCLSHETIYVWTRNCNASGNNQFFVPEDLPHGYQFRWPGKTTTIAFQEPPRNDLHMFMAPIGGSGYGEEWRFLFPANDN